MIPKIYSNQTLKAVPSPAKTILVIVACILLCEIIVRVKAADFSNNVSQLRSYPQLLKDAAESPESGFIFLGNSLTGDGLSIDRWKAGDARFKQSAALKVVPDGSSVWDWRCLARQSFAPSTASKTVVIGFAWDQLSDATPINVAKTFGLVCDFRDLIDVSHPAGLKFEQRLEGVASKFFLSYALRERIRNRLLGSVVPSFEDVAQTLNAVSRGNSASGAPPKSTYLATSKMIAELRAKGYLVVVVAMPVARNYDVDGDLVEAIRTAGGSFLDARRLAVLTATDYKDGIHLKPNAADVFSSALAKRMAALL